MYHADIHDTFPHENNPTYVRDRHGRATQERYYNLKRNYYKRQHLLGLAKWDTSERAALPYAYILYKRKDKYRTRPIVSCRREPNSRHQKIAARAANFVVQELTAAGDSFTLWKCTDLASNVRSEMQQSNS